MQFARPCGLFAGCRGAFLALLLVGSLMPAVQAQQVQATRLLPPPTNFHNVFVGLRVDISGEWLATSDITANYLGEVYLYQRSGTGWELKDTVHGVGSSKFGNSIALDGDTLAVGAPNLDGAAVDSGMVAIYERQGGRWALRERVHPPRSMPQTFFGWGVAMEESVLVVGAIGEDIPAANSGAVHVFEKLGGRFSHAKTARLPRTPDVLQGRHRVLGASVAVDGRTVVAGAPSSRGAALVLEKDDYGWKRTALLTDPALQAGDAFGHSVAVEGDTIVVGEPAPGPGPDRRGAVLVFERGSGGQWSLATRLVASDGFANANRTDQFGWSVAIHDDVIVAGSVNGRFNGNDTGTAYLFERCSPLSWCEAERLVSTSPEDVSESLGASVAIDGGFVVAGAPGTRADNSLLRGATYIFERAISTRLCAGEINSTGAVAEASVVGDETSWVLSGRGLPRNTPVVLLSSSGAASSVPFPSGLCLGPAARRVATGSTGSGGTVFLALGVHGSTNASRLNFQLWYRDQNTSRFSSAATLRLE